jgi:hypothetical protein
MAKKTWNIPVTYEMCGVVEVEAESLRAAMALVALANGEDAYITISLPTDANYVEGSLRGSHELSDVESVRSCYNKEQKDGECIFFELELRSDIFNDTDFICGKGVRIPSVEEANEFYPIDCKDSTERIVDVNPIPEEEAREKYLFRNEADMPIFGLPEHVATPRGTFRVSARFETGAEAGNEGYGIYFTHEDFDVYTSHPIPEKPHHTLFALVPRGK